MRSCFARARMTVDCRFAKGRQSQLAKPYKPEEGYTATSVTSVITGVMRETTATTDFMTLMTLLTLFRGSIIKRSVPPCDCPSGHAIARPPDLIRKSVISVISVLKPVDIGLLT